MSLYLPIPPLWSFAKHWVIHLFWRLHCPHQILDLSLKQAGFTSVPVSVAHRKFVGFPSGSAGKESLQCGRPGFDPWVGKILWRREQLPTPVFWPGEFHGLFSPWGHKESGTTERLSLPLCAGCHEKHFCMHYPFDVLRNSMMYILFLLSLIY